MQNLTGFVSGLLVILLVPGPTNTLLATSGATVGLYRSLHLLICELVGYDAAIVVIRTLVVPAIERVPAGTRWLHVAAAVYLLGLAVILWRTRLQPGTRAVRARHVLITTFLNPKALVIGLVLIPIGHVAVTSYLVILSALLPIVGTAWICAGRFAGQSAPVRLTAAVPKLASITLGAFAALLLASLIS